MESPSRRSTRACHASFCNACFSTCMSVSVCPSFYIVEHHDEWSGLCQAIP
eukprot:m.226886 g.226886  ORF g.226886 m.226886 type:complete len:51 (-) comp36497_c0_seq1:227-379(-)